MANKMQYLQCSWILSNDLKHNEASFSTISTDILYLWVAQMPGSPDLAIFVLMTTQTMTDKSDYFTPSTCTQGKIKILCEQRNCLVKLADVLTRCSSHPQGKNCLETATYGCLVEPCNASRQPILQYWPYWIKVVIFMCARVSSPLI